MGAFKEPLNITQDKAYFTDKNICWKCGNKLKETNGRKVCDTCVNVFKIWLKK